jgi:ABC-type ATPase involved in cell division
VNIPESARRRHTYMVAKSGAGKSEFLKQLIHPLLLEKTCAAAVIYPAGDFAE